MAGFVSSCFTKKSCLAKPTLEFPSSLIAKSSAYAAKEGGYCFTSKSFSCYSVVFIQDKSVKALYFKETLSVL